jgi:hypothetical protein
MTLKALDKAFLLPKITHVDYTTVEIERTFLNLFPRLKFDGYMGKVRKGSIQLTIEKFVEEFIDPKNQQEFIGFADCPEIVYKWLETDLLDLVNRGKPNQAVVSPRPLHGNTYKYRNTKHAKDRGTSEQIFWMLYHARLGQAVRDALKDYIFAGLDPQTDKIEAGDRKIDVETQAILHFDQKVSTPDREDRSKEPDRYPPLCSSQADLLADDVLRLLTYENYMPRSVLVDYLKTLLSFHLALYHLKLLKLLPAIVQRQGGDPICAKCPVNSQSDRIYGECAYSIGLVVDLGDPENSHMAELARRSCDRHYRRIPTYIQAHFIAKKLDEMASNLYKRGKFAPATDNFTIGEVLQLLQPNYNQERENFFESRLSQLIEGYEQGEDSSLPPEIEKIIELQLSNFETYIEILVALRGTIHRRRITECLDSLLLKNRESGLLRQPRTKPRWFVFGSRLLEVLLQIAVLEPQDGKFKTREIRIDELLQFLRERYGLYIDRLPTEDGFEEPSIKDRQALRKNVQAFKTRLREIGFFQDLSDAYVTQTVTPRYTISAEEGKG